jgi:hypothetical protein
MNTKKLVKITSTLFLSIGLSSTVWAYDAAFKNLDNSFALIMDSSPSLTKEVLDYTRKAKKMGLKTKKIGKYSVVENVLMYANFNQDKILLSEHTIGPGFSKTITLYDVSNNKAVKKDEVWISSASELTFKTNGNKVIIICDGDPSCSGEKNILGK